MSEKKQHEQPAAPPVMPPMWWGPPPEEEIDLLEYWRVLVRERWKVLGAMLAAGMLAAGISLLMPNIYRAEVLLAPAQEEKGPNLPGGLGGLAAMAGISLGGGGDVDQAIAVLTSREFLWKFIQDNNLLPVLFADDWDAEKKRWKESDPEKQPDLWDGYRLLKKKVISVDKDKKSNLVTLKVEWKDPKLAAKWANDLARRINAYMRERDIAAAERNLRYLREKLKQTQQEELRQALYALIEQQEKKAMLASTQEEYVFRILDPAAPPDKKAKPKRALITLLAMLVAGFLAIIYVFAAEGIRRRREEEESQQPVSG